MGMFLTACQSVPKKADIPQVQRTPPSDAMVYCPDLTELKDASFETIVKKLDEVGGEYYLCQSKQKELVDWIKEGQKKKK